MRADIVIARHVELAIGALPHELLPIDINQLAEQHAAIGIDRIRIGEIEAQDRVVFGGIGAEQQRSIAVKAQFKPRQKPRVLVIEAIRVAVDARHVAERVEHGERIAMFENPCSRLAERAGRLDAELRIVVRFRQYYRHAWCSSAAVCMDEPQSAA